MYLDAIVDNDKKTGDNGLRRILEIETKPDGKRLYDFALRNQDMLALIKSKIIEGGHIDAATGKVISLPPPTPPPAPKKCRHCGNVNTLDGQGYVNLVLGPTISCNGSMQAFCLEF